MARLGSGDGTRRRSRRGVSAELSLWPDPELRGARRPGRAFLLAARVRLHRYSLDRKLALGDDPSASPKLARRAQELCQPALRVRLAAELDQVVQAAGVPPRGLTPAVPLDRSCINACRPLLWELAEALRSDGAVYAQGVASARLLLVDGCSPIYAPSEARRLEAELRRARNALFAG